MAKKVMQKKGAGEYRNIPSKNFCLAVPKNFVREIFNRSLISGNEKNYAAEGYVKMFRRNFFVSEHRNIS